MQRSLWTIVTLLSLQKRWVFCCLTSRRLILMLRSSHPIGHISGDTSILYSVMGRSFGSMNVVITAKITNPSAF